MSLPPMPSTSLLGYIGILLLFLGIGLFLAGVGVIQVAQVTIPVGRRTWFLGLVATAIGAICLTTDLSRTVIVNPTNITSFGRITASSVSTQANGCQRETQIADGVAAGYPQNTCNEWVSKSELDGAWIKVTFPVLYRINRIVLYDRPNTTDNILAATLKFSDGSEIPVDSLPVNGQAKNIPIDNKVIQWVEVHIDHAEGQNVGLAEVEIYGWQENK